VDLAIIQYTTFSAIASNVSSIGFWAFPIEVVRQADGKVRKTPVVKWGEFQGRPPSTAEVEKWSAQFYRVGIGAGIPTGPATGFFAIDADSVEAIEYIEKRGGFETWIIRTPRGLHYYFKIPLDFSIRNSTGEIYEHLDVRGAGGYVVAPGTYVPASPFCLSSVTWDEVAAFSYGWAEGCSPADTPLGDAPPWLLTELRDRAQRETPATPPASPRAYRGRVGAWARRAFDANLEYLASAAPGTRNDAFFHVARRLGQLVAGGELRDHVALTELNRIADGWPNSAHSRDTASRGFKMGLERPCAAPRRQKRAVEPVELDPYAPAQSSPREAWT